jgi:hypothetical protein
MGIAHLVSCKTRCNVKPEVSDITFPIIVVFIGIYFKGKGSK